MEFLKDVLGEDLFKQVSEKITQKGIKIADITKGEFIPRNKFNDKSEELKLYKEKYEALEKKTKDIDKLVSNNEDLKKQIDTLNTDYNTKLSDKDNQIANITKISGIKEILNQNKVLYPDLVLKSIDMNNIKIKEDGSFENFDIKAIKDKYPSMFENTVEKGNTNPQQGLTKQQSSKKTQLIERYNKAMEARDFITMASLQRQIQNLKE